MNRFQITPFEEGIKVRTFSDSQDKGKPNSIIDGFSKEGNSFIFKYRVGTNYEEAYVGVLFEKAEWDFSKYDRVTVTVDPKQCDPFTLIFVDFVPGFSDVNNDLTWRVYEYGITPIKGQRKYTVMLKDFSTPGWWYALYEKKFDMEPKNKLKHVRQIQLQNHELAKPNTPLEISFSTLIFSSNNFVFTPIWIVPILLIIALVLTQNRGSVPIAYNDIPSNSKFNDGELSIIEFIGTHYTRHDMSLTLVSIETGLTQKDIRTLLQKSFDKSFKQYLTEIRLGEAKRLLLETDRLIADIALYVGYKHATTFTRLFREQFGLSPRDYREKREK